jgi:hypothetical protein
MYPNRLFSAELAVNEVEIEMLLCILIEKGDKRFRHQPQENEGHDGWVL